MLKLRVLLNQRKLKNSSIEIVPCCRWVQEPRRLSLSAPQPETSRAPPVPTASRRCAPTCAQREPCRRLLPACLRAWLRAHESCTTVTRSPEEKAIMGSRDHWLLLWSLVVDILCSTPWLSNSSEVSGCVQTLYLSRRICAFLKALKAFKAFKNVVLIHSFVLYLFIFWPGFPKES